MTLPQIPINETERVQSLHSYSLLDTLPEEEYNNITKLAAYICGTPISLISLIDEKRQWFKSKHGLEAQETLRDFAFCAHAINTPEKALIVENARLDERFHDNPLVQDDPNIIFYAGIPLKSTNGLGLGTLCVIDNTPRNLTPEQISNLKALASQVENLFESRKNHLS